MYYIIVLVFVGLSTLYYSFPFGIVEQYGVLLTISTFLFSIFAGFFIARQGNRYSEIRNKITEFDGNISSIYRQSGHLDLEVQKGIEKAATIHYENIIKNMAWDYNLIHKSSTLQSIHGLLEKHIGEAKLSSLDNAVVNRTIAALLNLQRLRKNLIALHNEKIPSSQWALLYGLAFILLLSLSIIPSSGMLYVSVLKAAFASTIIFVIVLLQKFDRLEFFEKTIGQESAQDVLDIFADRK